ncbi:MAG: anthranilate phosphoribosyltransferase [Proteobacteria bacterium]|nr:anthranilate phosphoribosyltransferase [Pseudomonadota bacterium]
MNTKEAIAKVSLKQDLTSEEMTEVVKDIMTGQATPAQIGGFLVGLRMKGETINEIVAATNVMRQLALPISISEKHLVDIVGTGADQAHTFNISTAASFVVAAAGGTVAKHGSYASSSHCGSADILQALGVKIDMPPEKTADCIQKIGIGFLLATQYHLATQHVRGPRKEVGMNTLFNLLGPLTNPTHPKNYLMGVYDRNLLSFFANALKLLGSEHALIVHSEDGLDEISISAKTHVAELHHGKITTYEIKPEDYQLKRADLSLIQTTDLEHSLALFRQVFDNVPGPARDIVLLNAGAAIYAANLTGSIAEGIEKAKQALATGTAKKKLEDLIQFGKTI